MNFTTWWKENEPSERHLDDWTHKDLQEFARKAWEASQAALAPKTAADASVRNRREELSGA
jgi:hypothetical protein